MPDSSFLGWPFFAAHHRALAEEADAWAAATIPDLVDHADPDGSCIRLAAALGGAGFLVHPVPEDGFFDVRSLCLLRETFARHDALADFAFAMQGLGTGAVSLFGDAALKDAVLPAARAGTSLAAFALTEPEAGSDVASIALTATAVGADRVRLDGEKTWISNGGIAATYVVFARTGEAPGARGISAFLVPADTPGLMIAERLETISPHPLARLTFDGCEVPLGNRIGEPGAGFKVAMATLDVFRPTVGAAALGFARRALDVSLARARGRTLFGGVLADLPLAQATLAEMATAIDAAALLVYRAAWARDVGDVRITREAAMAKMVATENAQKVIDAAVQLHGGEGVRAGSVPETLYRDVRALRIYEGATEVQKLIIARQILAGPT